MLRWEEEFRIQRGTLWVDLRPVWVTWLIILTEQLPPSTDPGNNGTTGSRLYSEVVIGVEDVAQW